MKISTNKYVTLTYDLHVGEDEERELVEQATIKKPLEFVFGVNAMLEAFENYLEGLEEGDRFSFSIAPKKHMANTTKIESSICRRPFSRLTAK